MTEPKRRPDLESSGWPEDDASADLGRAATRSDTGDSATHARPLAHHDLPELQEQLSHEEVDRLTVLETGTQLTPGTSYLDLRQRGRGPFDGQAGDSVQEGQLIVSKRDVDHELWNRLVGVER